MDRRSKTLSALSTGIVLLSLFVLAGTTPCAAQGCVGCTPLDAAGGPPYLGTYPLGLYTGGSNSPPPAHATLAMNAAAAVVPRNASGNPDPDGLVGFIAIGMSNTNQEFATFERQQDLNLTRNGRLVILDTAVGGQSADVIRDPAAPYWLTVSARVAAAGLDPDQVQVAWLKEAEGDVPDTTFPTHAETLEVHVADIVRNLKDTFPRLQICYLASRIYGGNTSNPERGEPLSYETGFAYRNLIDAQTSGDPTLNPDPSAGVVEAPVLLWGPYLWANGTIPRASDGLTWVPGDFESDGIHPSASGEAKVAGLLGNFVATNGTATPWYLADTGTDLVTIAAVADAYVDDTAPGTNFGGLASLTWRYNTQRSYVRFDLASVTGVVVHAKLSFKTPPTDGIREAEVVVVSNTTWGELTINSSNAPAFDGAVLGTIPMASAGTAISLDVTSAVQAAIAAAPPGTALLSLGIRATPGAQLAQIVGSRQSPEPPRLVITTEPVKTTVCPPTGDYAEAPSTMRLSAWPNPANGGARITLSLPHALDGVTVAIHDASGARVRTLLGGGSAQPSQQFDWDGRDDRGRALPSGTYFARATARGEGTIATHKLNLVR